MKKWYYLLVFSAGIGCNAEQAVHQSLPDINTPVAESSVFSDTAFREQHAAGNYETSIYGITRGNEQEVVVLALSEGKLLSDIRRTVRGNLTSSATADLNQNSFPEIYLVVQASSGGKNLLAFELSGEGYSEIAVPDTLRSRLAEDITLSSNQLTITYAPGSGKSRSQQYMLDNKGKLVGI